MYDLEEATYDWIIQQLFDGKIYTSLPDYLRKSWVRYCYHYSALENIVSILNAGILYSRNQSSKLEIMLNDNASNDVISNTDGWIKDYVRFYFRPKTPTQFNNEGFRSKDTMTKYHAHCPFPVFLLFDFKSILNLNNCYFTSSSLANRLVHDLLSTPEEFLELPFSKIYHVGSFPSEMRDEIVSSRQAEIIVPDHLKIDGLIKKILVRSSAEKRTLLALLDSKATQKYSDLIQIDSKKTVFLGRWMYIEDVILSYDSILIKSNCGEQPTKFKIDVLVKDFDNNIEQTYSNDEWLCRPEFILGIGTPTHNYSVRISLNEHLAFFDKYNHSENADMPF